MNIDYIESKLNYKLPNELKKIVTLNLLDFDVWYIMNDQQIIDRFLGLKERYNDRQLIPFAKRDDCDDIACFEKNQGKKVFIIHDFATSGYEKRETFDDLWSWLESAIKDLIEYSREEEMYEQ